MGAARSDDRRASLARCRDPGFTPGVRDVEGLLALWRRTRAGGPEGDDPRGAAAVITAALARGDRGVGRALRDGWSAVDGEQRAMRVRVLGRIARRLELPELPELGPWLVRALEDPEPRVVREAARALGKLELGSPDAYERPLLRVWQTAALPEQRAAVDALGRLGGALSLTQLRAHASADDDLIRRTEAAITLIERRAGRDDAGRVVLERPLPQPLPVRLRCRAGAEAVVADQVATLLPQVRIERREPGAVSLRWSDRLAPLYRVRSATDVALEFPLPAGASLADRVVAGLEHPPLVAALQAWTEGAPRFRLAFSSGGRRRALIWQIARRIARQELALRNDSRVAAWTIEVDETRERLRCRPRGADPRFAYRRRDVPAATHPTLAALMAWAARPRRGERVWDPFCGSGSELVEAALLQPGLHLYGTDVSEDALAAARTNLAAAPIEAASLRLTRASALHVARHRDLGPFDVILSNPPMGRRVKVEGRKHRLLEDFVRRAAPLLGSTGRMVWLSPDATATAGFARRVGLQAEDLDAIDMGGFVATPQIVRPRR